ncbi:hypothetical protein OG216_00635 [Streptomycetaceae bacterium NBC_01309]
MVTARERWLGRTDVNPVYVVVGVGDLAVEKARGVSTMVVQGRIDIPVGVRPLRYRVSNTVAQVQSTIGGTVDAIGKNPGGYVRSRYGRALDAYEDLGIRGHKVVARVRGRAEEAADDARRVKGEATRDAARLKDHAKGDVRGLKDDARDRARELGVEAKEDVRRTAAKTRAASASGTGSGARSRSGARTSGISASSSASGSRAKASRTKPSSGPAPGR